MIQFFGLVSENADGHVDTIRAQMLDAAPGHAGIRILSADDDTPHAGLDDARRTGAGAAGVATGLERTVERRAARAGTRIGQGVNLGVRTARELVRAAADDHALIVHDHRANHRVRAGTSPPALGEREGTGHVEDIAGAAYHFS